jgi:hypothetical protein
MSNLSLPAALNDRSIFTVPLATAIGGYLKSLRKEIVDFVEQKDTRDCRILSI